MKLQLLRMHAPNSLLRAAGDAAPASETQSYRKGWQEAQDQLDQLLQDQLIISYSRKRAILHR